MNTQFLVDAIKSNMRPNGTFNAGLFQPVLKGDRTFVELNGKMVDVENASKDPALRFLRNAYGLPEGVWKELGATIEGEVGNFKSAYGDLVSKGRVVNVADAGVLLYKQEKHSGLGEADQNMTGESTSNDEFKFDVDAVPLPVTLKEVKLGFRQIAALARGNFSFSTNSIITVTDVILDKLEYNVFMGGISFAGNTVYGYTTSSARKTGSLTYNWSSCTGAQVLEDMIDIGASIRTQKVKHEFGPAMVYIPTGWDSNLDNNFSTSYPGSVRDRIKKLDWVEDIRVSSYCPDNQVVVAFLQPKYVNLIRGAGIQPILWQSEDGLKTHMKLLAIEAPLITDDYSGNKGVFHFTKS